MLARSLAPFARLLSIFCKFSITGLISGLRFSLLYKISFLSYFSLKIVIFSSLVEFLENISALSLKQDLVYSHQSIAEERLYPWPRPEGSYKIGSACPSFCLPVSFLGIGSLVFSATKHNVRDPYIVVCDSWIFWKKSPSGKNGQKWSKSIKKMSLVLPVICVKTKFLWFINILRELHAWEKSSSQVKDKNGS